MISREFKSDDAIINGESIVVSKEKIEKFLNLLDTPNLSEDEEKLNDIMNDYVEYANKTFLFQNRTISVPNFRGFQPVDEKSYNKLDADMKKFSKMKRPSLSFLVLNAMLLGYQQGKHDTIITLKDQLIDKTE